MKECFSAADFVGNDVASLHQHIDMNFHKGARRAVSLQAIHKPYLLLRMANIFHCSTLKLNNGTISGRLYVGLNPYINPHSSKNYKIRKLENDGCKRGDSSKDTSMTSKPNST